MLENYKLEKENLLKRFDKIKELGLIPIDNINLKDLENKKINLQNEKFLVSFSGQIKAGKSTLVNAILFGKEVLPSDDTPHTAKITIIEYGEKEEFEAQFYSKKEWEELKNAKYQDEQNIKDIAKNILLNKDEQNIKDIAKNILLNKNNEKSYFKEFLEQDVIYSQENGIYTDEIIGKSKRESDLSKLNEYVANKGIYTPFVKSVTISYPNELLKEVSFVDTPGTNDPNVFRSKMTEEWIHNSNANVYITYAGQAMSKEDKEFIDKFLIGVPTSQRIVAVNKIDLVNLDDVKSWIDELKNSKEFKVTGIFNNSNSIVYVSSLGALIDKMDSANLELSKKLEFYADKLDENGYLNDKNHNLSKLIHLIETKIIENKGKALIESNAKFINSIFDKNINKLELDIKLKDETLKNLVMDKEELEKKQKDIKLEKKRIDKEISELEKNLISLYQAKLNEIEKEIKNIKDIAFKNIEQKLKEFMVIKEFKNKTNWVIKDELEAQVLILRNSIQNITLEISENIKKEIDEFDATINHNNTINLTFISKIIHINTLELRDSILKTVDIDFNIEKMNFIIKDNTNFIQRLLQTSGGRDNIIISLEPKIKEYLEKVFDKDVSKYLNEDIKKQLNIVIEKIKKEIIEVFENMDKEIKEILQNLDSRKENIIKVENEKIELEKRVKEIELFNWM